MANRLKIKPLNTFPPAFRLGTGRGEPCDIKVQRAIGDLVAECQGWAEDRSDPEYDRFIAITKAIGIAADVCASAYARTHDAEDGRPIAEFVAESLAAGLKPADLDELMWRYVWDHADEDVNRPDNQEGFPHGFQFRQFQLDIAESDHDSAPRSLLTLAVAGCGSGKSLAAYLWAWRWCQAWAVEGLTDFRFHFTLPTTGTATEHFKDYALACGVSPKLKGLSHSRSTVDLAFVAQETAPQEEGRDPSDTSKQAVEMLKAQADKIESLDLWGTPLVVGTADTVLGLMANARRSAYSFPALMKSSFVFDEIHAYDEELFGHLLAFLETFPNIPVLLMTASLPKARQAAIEAVRRDLRIVKGPEEHEVRRRYEIPRLISKEEVWDRIRDCLSNPSLGKVLWVRNQVDWAVDSYQDCFKRLSGPKPFIGLYHSRFRYKDRARVHAEVVKKFKSPGEPCILVATQVAEMSLDLSADLLITDLAPIPALIQRLGRLNRFAETDEGPSGVSFFTKPPDFPPYFEEDLARAQEWHDELGKQKRRLSQRDLSKAFSGLDDGQAVDLQKARRRAVFVSGLWQTFPASTRGEGYTMTVVLQEDYEDFPEARLRDAAFRRDWLRENEVSIPIRAEMRAWKTFGRTPIAPRDAVTYGHIDSQDPSRRTGAKWDDRR
jgi:CRISPR-associated endonuclease/helicase Cas3